MSKKIQFDMKFRPQIESGEYKVETRDGRIAKIIYWEAHHSMPIITLITSGVDNITETPIQLYKNGKFYPKGESNFDLFIITPEPELTEWQILISACLQKYGLLDCSASYRIAKESSAELLSFARKQLIKDGYVIEKKTFHDAVKRVDPEVMKEVSENIDNEITQLTKFERAFHKFAKGYHDDNHPDDMSYCKEYAAKLLAMAKEECKNQIENDYREIIYGAYKKGMDEALKDLEETGKVHCKSYDKGYEDGMKEALKDLPRWKKVQLNTGQTTLVVGYTSDEDKLYRNGYVVSLSDLDKLPKEDEK